MSFILVAGIISDKAADSLMRTRSAPPELKSWFLKLYGILSRKIIFKSH
jgi:hypothetical protein